MCGEITTEFPNLTASNFENSLASDDLLVHFFNDFLSLPLFPESLLYNQATGLFEVANGAAEFVSSRIKSVLSHRKSQLLTGDPTELCLDREQGIQWIVEERLPFFLQSDYYNEYRLAKLFQQELNLCIQRRNCSSGQRAASATQFGEENNNPLKVLTHSQSPENISTPQVACLLSGQSKAIKTKNCMPPRCSSSFAEPGNLSSVSSGSASTSSNLKSEKSPQTAQTTPSAGNPVDERLKESSGHSYESSELQLEYLAAAVVKQVLNNALTVMGDQSQTNTSECFSKSGEQMDGTSTAKSWEFKACLHSADGCRERSGAREEKVQEDQRGTGVEQRTEGFKNYWEVGSSGAYHENVLDMCCHGICHQGRPGLDEFKEFLRGTLGEKLFNLWMDIERLRSTHNRERKNRHLAIMRSCYLLSSSQSTLNVELLSSLGLTTPPCWTEEKLQSVQSLLTGSLLYYWAPRFWTSKCVEEDDLPRAGMWTDWCVSPVPDTQPHNGSMTLHLAHQHNCQPQSYTVQTQFYAGRREMAKMLQALSVDVCAGSYLTTFCEQSGNQLWENAVHFWSDLQHYYELFYQDGLDPYRVQREAQLLYSTYLLSSATRGIGVDEEVRREVYDRMMPAFEELFDNVEEHTLNILLEPWKLLVNRDKESFQKVCVWEEVRYVESQEYRELQSLNEKSERWLKQVEQDKFLTFASSVTPPFPLYKGPQVPDSWSRVSPNYHGYRLGTLLHHRHEISHFMSFLQGQEASIHLSCWLDLEQYRRTPQRDNAVREKRSSHIASKYLNSKYFFGPDSPASTQQQNDILRLAGGLERLKLEGLSNPVAMEIQDIIKSHIERKWLPLFLSTTEFIERQKHQQKTQAADSLSQQVYGRRRTRRGAWKAEGLWMSSSKEILLFRRLLLNPVTCKQFQHFVSLKGDFLENDILFWLEVQRYKDLCHSHSDEATIQQKITTIITCFIHSSTPPTLQIDIPPEQAQHILENRQDLGPYIFREAQMSVFSELLKFWPEFQQLRSSVREEQLLPLLQEKQVKYKARVRRQRRKEEEHEEERRRAQAELERPQSSYGEEEAIYDEDEGRSEKRQLRTDGSRASLTPTQPLSWSYSKYMAALRREEVLLRRQSLLEASSSTASDSDCSFKSAGSEFSHLPPVRRSAESKQHNRYNRGLQHEK